METTTLNKTAKNRDSKELLIESINYALRSKNVFTDDACCNIPNIFDTIENLTGQVLELSEELKDEKIYNKITSKVHQLNTLVDVVRKSINSNSIENAETAFSCMEKYKETISNNTLESEIYIKDMMAAFISSKGLSGEYYDEFRYFYANENLKEFSRTTMFPGYMEKLAENGNITEIERIKRELEYM